MANSKLIVVEGPQGAGKTTITDFFRYSLSYTNLYRLCGTSDSSPTGRQKSKEMYENFHKQFHQLSYHEQRVLYLRYVEELSLKEISEKLHIQKSSVNTLLCRIRKKARKLISEQMDEGGNQNE